MVDDLLKKADADFSNAIEHLKKEFAGLQIGRASAALVDHLEVDAYGSNQPLKTLANISIPDPKTVQIQPWDKGMLQAIEKANQNSDLNIAPSNDGVVIRLSIPPLTEDRRSELTKVVHRMAEDARIHVRQGRQKVLDKAKEMQKSSELSEDQLRSCEKRLQEKVDSTNSDIENLSKSKEKEMMTV